MNEIRIEGIIASEKWFNYHITPQEVRDMLKDQKGDLTVWLCSDGGDVVAGSQIYTLLKEYKGKVTIKVDGLAASAASVIAMAGDTVEMAPTSLLMIHDPMMLAFGNAADLQKGIEILGEVKEAIINAYELKSGMERDKLAELMREETWLNANRAVELGFADSIMYKDGKKPQITDEISKYRYII